MVGLIKKIIRNRKIKINWERIGNQLIITLVNNLKKIIWSSEGIGKVRTNASNIVADKFKN